jgi:hypothetical protein
LNLAVSIQMRLLLLIAALAIGFHPGPTAVAETSFQLPDSRPTLWILDPRPLTPSGQALAASAQGILNQDSPRVWFTSGGLHRQVLERVRSRFNTVEVQSSWALIASNRSAFSGFLTCSITNHTFNLATSLAGTRRALVMDISLRQQALEAGLPELEDLRAVPAGDAFAQYARTARRAVLIHQPISKPLHLRDLAVALGAWVDFEPATPSLTAMVAALGPHTEVLGWGSEEHQFVRDVSQGGGWVIPADWALNLSAHRWLQDSTDLPQTTPRPPPTPLRPGERAVAFVVSDGDNVQWLLGGFTDSPGFWASPRRGSFPVSWEIAPRLRILAPAADAWLRRTATPNDDFVGGPSGGGYHFPHHVPDRAGLSVRSARSLANAGLSVTSVLNSEGSPEELDALLLDPEIHGVLYKDYAPYNRRRGALAWVRNKPVLAYRHLLWEEQRRDGSLRPDWLPEGVARAIAGQAPNDPFALIQVHAWSFRKQGGPMEAIHKTIQLLPPDTRVVPASDLLRMLRQTQPANGN